LRQTCREAVLQKLRESRPGKWGNASQAINLFAVACYADDCRCFSRICAATPISGSRERRMAIENRH
jgi:hypothetical protein